MTPLPKKRHSTHRKGKRRASISLAKQKLVPCKNCKSFVLSHTVCPTCGYYNSVEIVKPKPTKKEREQLREQKEKEKETKKKEKQKAKKNQKSQKTKNANENKKRSKTQKKGTNS
jgi:large subunit ribosomal protein L32